MPEPFLIPELWQGWYLNSEQFDYKIRLLTTVWDELLTFSKEKTMSHVNLDGFSLPPGILIPRGSGGET